MRGSRIRILVRVLVIDPRFTHKQLEEREEIGMRTFTGWVFRHLGVVRMILRFEDVRTCICRRTDNPLV